MIKFSDHAWTFRRQIVALLGIALHVKEVERIVGEEPAMNGTDQSIALCAVRTERYRLIRTIHCGLFPYDPLYLFDMQSDPQQRHNLAAERPGVVAELDHLLLEWLWRYTTGPDGVRDPFQEQLEAGFDPDLYCPRQRIEERLLD